MYLEYGFNLNICCSHFWNSIMSMVIMMSTGYVCILKTNLYIKYSTLYRYVYKIIKLYLKNIINYQHDNQSIRKRYLTTQHRPNTFAPTLPWIQTLILPNTHPLIPPLLPNGLVTGVERHPEMPRLREGRQTVRWIGSTWKR